MNLADYAAGMASGAVLATVALLVLINAAVRRWNDKQQAANAEFDAEQRRLAERVVAWNRKLPQQRKGYR